MLTDIPADPVAAASLVAATVGTGLLVLDDLHWADDATLALLPALAEHGQLLISVRAGAGAGELRALDAARVAGAQAVDMHGLDDASMTRVIGEHAPTLDPSAVATVISRAGGTRSSHSSSRRRRYARSSRGCDRSEAR